MTAGALVVVGVDGSDDSRAALLWAMGEAAVRDAALDVVCAWLPESVLSPLGLPGPALDLAPFEAAAKRVLDDVIDAAPVSLRRSVPHIQAIAARGPASATLLQSASGAELLVVGTRGQGLAKRLGSVSHQCVHHSPCPVTVVPGGWPADRRPERIVCGVDGSDGSAAALAWAMHEAARWDSRLVVVHSWKTPYPIEPWGLVVTPRDQEVFTRGAELLVGEMLDAAVEGGAPMPGSVEARPIEDAAGPALSAAAADADLLVVGSRGRGGFAALLVGSVSLHCLHHAGCPVTVVKRASTQQPQPR